MRGHARAKGAQKCDEKPRNHRTNREAEKPRSTKQAEKPRSRRASREAEKPRSHQASWEAEKPRSPTNDANEMNERNKDRRSIKKTRFSNQHDRFKKPKWPMYKKPKWPIQQPKSRRDSKANWEATQRQKVRLKNLNVRLKNRNARFSNQNFRNKKVTSSASQDIKSACPLWIIRCTLSITRHHPRHPLWTTMLHLQGHRTVALAPPLNTMLHLHHHKTSTPHPLWTLRFSFF